MYLRSVFEQVPVYDFQFYFFASILERGNFQILN